MIFLCRSGLLRSRYLYFNLSSSLVLESSSIGNGGVSASESILNSLAIISSLPVARSAFSAPFLLTKVPDTAIQNSALILLAFSNISIPQDSSSKIICTIPLLSLKSKNMIPPLTLFLATQPITQTVSPTLASTTSAHLWLLFKPSIDSAII